MVTISGFFIFKFYVIKLCFFGNFILVKQNIYSFFILYCTKK